MRLLKNIQIEKISFLTFLLNKIYKVDLLFQVSLLN